MPEKTKQTLDPIAEKLPPQNVEAEQSVLGCLMLDKDAIIKIANILKPRDFYRGIHRTIYEAMVGLYEHNEPIDVLSASNKLKEGGNLDEIGGVSYLTTLVNSVPTTAHVTTYANIIQKKSTLRRLIAAASDITFKAYEEREDTEKVLDEAERRIFNVSQKYLHQNFIPIKPALEEAFERIDKLHKGDGVLRGIATGFYKLDDILGGLQRADLVILASRPSLGKTTLALDITRHVATKEKTPVGIFSLETSKEQIVDRLISAQAGVDLWKLRTGRLSFEGEDNDFSRIAHAMNILSQAPIYIDDVGSNKIMEMRTMARRLQAEHGLGLLVIDYLQLMQSTNSRESLVQQITEISRELKSLAKELNVPVLALSQLNRAVENRSPQIPRLSDLRESGCLAGDTLITQIDTGQQIPIKNLAKRKKQKIFPVLAMEKNYKLSTHQMIKVFPSGKKMVFELKTRTGRKIKASANHPFLKLEGWKRLDELEIGNHIALPRILSIQRPKNPLSNNELILLAHLLGDGCILPRQPFHYTSADKENIKIVKQTAQHLFNIRGRTIKQKNWYHLYLPSPHRLTHNKHHPITNWFKKLGIELVHSWEKRISDCVFQCEENKIALFLKHLWATDGNLSWKHLPGRKPAGNIYYATSSKVLGEQIQHLLLRLGIQSSNRKNTSKKKYRTMYHIYIEGAIEQLKFLTKVGIAGERKNLVPLIVKELKNIIPNTNIDIIPRKAWRTIVEPVKKKAGIGWRTLQQRINTSYCGSTLFKHGIGRERMMRVYQALKNPILYNLATSDIFWDKIVSIKKIGVEEVYDATVNGVHNFIANDIIVHNSLEQDADVVLFIYREDREKKDTSRQNIADIIIGKHRNGPIGKVGLYFNENHVSFKNLETKRDSSASSP